MVRCWKCGRDNDEAMRFCTNCGTPMTPSQAVDSAGYNASQAETISFNPTAQTAVRPVTPTNPYTSGPPFTQSAPKSRIGMIVGIVVGALLLGLIGLGVLGGYIYYSNSGNVAVNSGNTNRRTIDPDTKATPSPSPTAEPSPTPKPQSFEPPTEPTKEGTFTVYANEGWQLSDLAVVPLERYTTRVQGIVDISEVKTGVQAGGVSDAKFKSRRLFPEFPVGALIMRTRYADGRFSNMVAMGVNGSWENLPEERGMLEFIINDNAPENNGGQYTIKLKMTSVPKK